MINKIIKKLLSPILGEHTMIELDSDIELEFDLNPDIEIEVQTSIRIKTGLLQLIELKEKFGDTIKVFVYTDGKFRIEINTGLVFNNKFRLIENYIGSIYVSDYSRDMIIHLNHLISQANRYNKLYNESIAYIQPMDYDLLSLVDA